MVPPPHNESSLWLYNVPKASFPSLQETVYIENKYDLFNETDTVHSGHSSSLSVASCENVIGSYHVLHFPAYFYVWNIHLSIFLYSFIHLSVSFKNTSAFLRDVRHTILPEAISDMGIISHLIYLFFNFSNCSVCRNLLIDFKHISCRNFCKDY